MLMLEQGAVRLSIRGRVQGVGFRPAVCRLANSLHLRGWICNDGVSVLIHLQGSTSELRQFRLRLQAALPRSAQVESITEANANWDDIDGFHVRVQRNPPAVMLVRVPPDRAICDLCRCDIGDAGNRRRDHPFATCTDCGPRYSIIHEMPYERTSTAMAQFPMCRECRAEYEDEGDRRFHAEPIACPRCGPKIADDLHDAAQALRSGRILCLKGLGGYQLLVRADEDKAVIRLRERKHRPSKPFAVMVASVEAAGRIAHMTAAERELLTSPENPIVLFESRCAIADAVAPHVRQIGVMLPTTPLHLLLLQQLDIPVVATSGNRADEPIAFDEVGRDGLLEIADAIVDHDRPIVRRLDDSVARVIDGKAMMLRLARGYAPCVLPALERWASRYEIPAILAVGGQQKTALAL